MWPSDYIGAHYSGLCIVLLFIIKQSLKNVAIRLYRGSLLGTVYCIIIYNKAKPLKMWPSDYIGAHYSGLCIVLLFIIKQSL